MGISIDEASQIAAEVRDHGFSLIPGKPLSYLAAYFFTEVTAMIADFELRTGLTFPYASLRNYVNSLKDEYVVR